MVFCVPALYALLFGVVYASGILTGIPLGIVDLDHTTLSREVTNIFSNTQYFKVVPAVDSYQGLEQAMATGEVRAGLVIPENFAEQVAGHQPTKIQFVYDGSNLIWGYNIRRYAQDTFGQFSQTHMADYLTSLGFAPTEINDVLNTVSLNTEIWYNPALNYCNFLFPGLLLLILHQLGLLSAGLTVTREKERRCWLHYLSSPTPRWQIFVGKSLPYFLANFFNFILLISLARSFFNVDINGSLLLIILLGLLYDLVITAAGFAISVYSDNSLVVTRVVMLLSVPVFFTSGFTWPQAYIPPLISDLARLLPYSWMANAFLAVTQKGAEAGDIASSLIALSVMAGLSVVLALTLTGRRRVGNRTIAYFRTNQFEPYHQRNWNKI